MKKRLIGFGVAAVLLGGVLNANAVLMPLNVNGDLILYDGLGGKYWRQDLNEFTIQNFQEQTSSIDALSYSGNIGEWYMASLSDLQQLLNNYNVEEIGKAFLQSTLGYWEGRFADPGVVSGTHGHFVIQDANGDGLADKANNTLWDPLSFPANATFAATIPWGWATADTNEWGGLGAWVVADFVQTNTNPVPEPTTMLLFGTGLAGLAAVSRRRKK